MKQPYIGITGVMPGDVDFVRGLATRVLATKSGYYLAPAVLVSAKTLSGQPPGQPDRYPEIGVVRDLFTPHMATLNLVHFNSRAVGDELVEEMLYLQRRAGMHCHGFQLNIVWPDIDALRKFQKKIGNSSRMVLQVSRKAMAECDNDGYQIALRLRDYNRLVDTVLLDPSGGRGQDLDVEEMREMLLAIANHGPEDSYGGIGLGIAGGLEGGNLGRLSGLMREFPRLSFDAESKLRCSVTGRFHPEKTTEFVEGGIELVRLVT